MEERVIAKKEDWETMDMPVENKSFIYKRKLKPKELEKLRYGSIPREMEDKWFWYMEGNTLYVHRSWSGICVYIVEIDEASGEHKVTYNGDSNQVNFSGQQEAKQDFEDLLISWIGEETMDILQAIKERHSVRRYKDIPIEEDIREQLDKLVAEINEESGLHIQVIYDDPKGFDSKLAQYGSFSGVSNYIILAGDVNDDIEEKCGYYGEKLVLEAQCLGLNTCWAAMTFNKKAVAKMLSDSEKLCMVIALGYGETSGSPRKSKCVEDVVMAKGNMPDWFRAGVEAALLAPTAVNQQKFKIGIKDGQPKIMVAGIGFHTKVDLGIVKYHFEVASGRKPE